MSGFASATPSSISATKLAGSLTNFFMSGPPIGWLVLSVARLACRLDADRLADIVQHRGDRDDAGVRRADAALARERLPAAFRDPILRALDGLRRDGRGLAEHLAQIRVRLADVLLDLVTHGNQRVEQRFVAFDGTAALLDAFDRRGEHLLEVLEGDARLVAAQHAGSHEGRAPDRARAAADVPADDHADLQQKRADRAAIELVPIVLHDPEPRRERDAEIGVARGGIELGKVLLVAQRRLGGRSDRALE